MMYLRKANALLEKRVAEMARTLGERREFLDAIGAAVVACEPFAHVEWSVLDRAPVIVPVFKFSDWHIGEQTSKAETENFGEYNWAIAQERIGSISDSFLRWIDTLRNGYTITRCVVFGEGDYISGDIHHELSVTNEFPAPVQTAKAGLLMGETIAKIAAHFDGVTFYQVGADNHSRLEKKPRAKQKFQSGLSYLVHMIAEAYLTRCVNVKIIAAEGMKYIAEVEGWKFLIEHGDAVKSWMGIPYYGIERSRAREATIRMNTDRNFHYQSIAHWHVPAWVSGNILINGSLSGTSEYDHSSGRHSPPAQVAFLVSPTHGVFNFTPFQA
jgi:hypothetical protein